MTDYGKIFSRIWADPDFTQLDARAQQVYVMLISFSTRNFAGVVPVTLRRWAKATRDATAENLTDALKQLAAAKFVVVDWDTEELLIRTYIRNDEVYRQPNVMKSARKSALQVESPALRWALHDELKRLPEHKDADDTERVINALVEGLPRTPSEGFAEGLTKEFPEGSGVGAYVSTVGISPSPTPSTSPPPPPQPTRNPDDEPPPEQRPRRATGAELARSNFAAIPASGSPLAGEIVRAYGTHLATPVDPKTAREMTTVIDAGLQAGQTPAQIAAGIELWAASDSFAPSQIPKFVTKAAAARKRNGVGKPTEQGDLTIRLAEELIAEMDQP